MTPRPHQPVPAMDVGVGGDYPRDMCSCGDWFYDECPVREERAVAVRYLRDLAERYRSPHSSAMLQLSTLLDAARDIEEGRHVGERPKPWRP